MKKVKITVAKLAAAQLLAKAKEIEAAMTGNANFPSPPVLMPALSTQITNYETAFTAAGDRSRTALANLRVEKKALADMLRKNGEYVNTVASGNEAKLLTSGYDVYKTPVKVQLPGNVSNIEAKFTNIPGTIKLQWDRSVDTRYYNVFISGDNGATFTSLNTVIGRRLTVASLVSNKRYQFKVVPVNQNGEGPVSDIASQVAA